MFVNSMIVRDSSLFACVEVAKMFEFAFNTDQCSISILRIGHPRYPLVLFDICPLFFGVYAGGTFLGKFNFESGLPSSMAAASYALAACLAVSYVPGYFILPPSLICA